MWEIQVRAKHFSVEIVSVRNVTGESHRLRIVWTRVLKFFNKLSNQHL